MNSRNNPDNHSQRILALDALRGAALVGIVIGNVMWFSGYAVASPEARSSLATAAVDDAVAFAVHVFIDGKFYALFSLLFGVSFALIVQRAKDRGLAPASVVRGRLLGLAAIGLLHATFVWFGDIVSLYAAAAIPLLWVHTWPRRRLVALAAAALTAPVLVSAGLWAAHTIGTNAGFAGADPGHGPAALLPAFAHGSYPQLLSANAAFLSERWVLALYSSRLIRIFGMFVVGIIASRMMTAQPRPSAWLIVIALVSNLALATLDGVPLRPPSGLGLVREVVYTIAIPCGCFVYAALLWRWATQEGPMAKVLASAGRLSLTHYVSQSLVMATLFYGCGLGLWGRLGATLAVVVALVIVGVQILGSVVWLRWFGQGPLERLLRAGVRRGHAH